MRSVRISEKHARAIISDEPHPLLDAALDAIRAQLAPRPKSSAKKKTEAKRRTKREETAAIREAVFARADGRCEMHYGNGERCGLEATDLDHFFGRGKVPQSVRNTWALCGPDHRMKTNNHGGADYWLHSFIFHCERHGYTAEKRRAENRLAFVNARGGR